MDKSEHFEILSGKRNRMMANKKVSIIMGIYNCESTLEEAINSILEQTYNNWELIMCDDGSSDDTYQIAKKYKEKYGNKIILLKNPHNMGLNYTLNRCLAKATGEYIARMDGDDISLPERFEKEIEYLEAHKDVAIVSTPMIFFDQDGDWGISTEIADPQKKDFIRHSPVHCHAPCMIRKEAFLDVNGYTVDKRMLRFEDVNLWYKLYAKGYKGHNLPEPLYKMRDDQNAYHRRSLKSRMNGVYVTYKGFQMFHFPWYLYSYVLIDFLKHFIKGIIPPKLYIHIHKNKQKRANI